MFDSGRLPPVAARTTIQALERELPSSKWSLGNRILMILVGTDDARGFRQWKEVGRHVIKEANKFYREGVKLGREGSIKPNY